jgi:MFS family permease
MGFAVGPFVTGYLWTLADGVGGLAGWQWCYVFMAALGAVTAAGIWFLKHHAQPHHSDETTGVPKTPIDEYAGLPDLVKVSWFCAGAGIVALHLVVGVFPKSAEVYGVPVADRGLTLFLLYTMQALVGLSFIRSRMWMYRAVPLLAAGAFGVAGLVLFGSARTASLFIVAGLCYGVYSGMFYFYFVFHAIVHPSRAPRYVAVNESVVGLSGLIGPMVGGQLADRLTLSTPYYTAAAVIAAVVLLQGLIHARHRPAVNRWTRGRD